MATPNEVVRLSRISYSSYVCGYHEYQVIWTPQIGEVLDVLAEVDNPYDSAATAVQRESEVSRTCS